MLSMMQLTGRRFASLRVTAVTVRRSMSAWRYLGGDVSRLDVWRNAAHYVGIAGGRIV